MWDNLPLYLQEELEKINLEAARIVTGTTKLCSRNTLYLETGWEPLSRRRQKHRLVQLHKMIHNSTPQYLRDIIPTRHNRRTRQQDLIPTILCHSSSYYNDFFPSTIREWNSLPSELKLNPSTVTFKRLLNSDLTKPPSYYNNIKFTTPDFALTAVL